MIKHITFIGSDTVGRIVCTFPRLAWEEQLIVMQQVAQAAAKNLTPVTLELGGKDPAIILPYTNLERWISVWMRGI